MLFYSKKVISISDLLTKDRNERRKRLKFLIKIVGLPAIFFQIVILIPFIVPIDMVSILVGFTSIIVLIAIYAIFK